MEVKGDVEFNSISFEKKLAGLKDTQESINACCQWCLASRQYHKKIVSSWLNVLKRVKIEQRLTLFYLANDVIQYSKRRNYEFVESWGTTLQKATTMVRDEKIKHKILRIFKIWEQRGVYGEEFIADLCGLISASPAGKKSDEAHEFQSSYLIQKIKLCAQLEADTDLKLRELKEHNPKIQIDGDSLIASLKDRAHVDDVEKELDDFNKQMVAYINALKLEIKARAHLISLLTQAEKALESDKKDVKTVTSAYKAFAVRVKTLKKKLDEKLPALNSPLPSPDVNAPSPGPDSDIELSVTDNTNQPPPTTAVTTTDSVSDSASVPTPVKSTPPEVFNAATLYTNAGYYNPVPPPTPSQITESSNSFNSHFSTFIGSDLSFNLENLRKSFNAEQAEGKNTTVGASSQTQTNSYNVNDAISSLFPSMAFPPPPPATSNSTSVQYGNSSHIPLQPPPMPPFSKNNDTYSGSRSQETLNANTVPQVPQSSVTATSTNYEPPPPNQFPTNEEYNPEEELETWAPEPTWDTLPPVEMDTPESPPMYEKAGYGDPVEYREGVTMGNVEDVDHRVMPGNDILSRTGDVDHRNLISLTESPNNQDQDYRNLNSPTERSRDSLDQDYRTTFNIDNFKLPPPPPPPMKMPPGEMLNDINVFNAYTQPPLHNHFNNYMNSQNAEPHMISKPYGFSDDSPTNDGLNVNMGLSESSSDVCMPEGSDNEMDDSDMNMMRNPSPENDCFELPPPFPDLLDDMDANQFLDNVTEDLEEFDTDDLDGLDQFPQVSSVVSDCPPIFSMIFANPPNPNMFAPQIPPPPPPLPWMNMMPPNQFPPFQNFPNHISDEQVMFNNRGRGNWGANRGFNDFRGNGRRGSRGGLGFRGNRGGDRGSWNSRGRGNRGRADFRGTFRNNF